MLRGGGAASRSSAIPIERDTSSREHQSVARAPRIPLRTVNVLTLFREMIRVQRFGPCGVETYEYVGGPQHESLPRRNRAVRDVSADGATVAQFHSFTDRERV